MARFSILGRTVSGAAILALALAGCSTSGQSASPAPSKDDSAVQVKTPEGLINDGTLTVCASSGTFMPMYQTNSNGELEGFAPSLAKAIAEAWGVSLKFEAMSFQGQFPALQAHRCDYIQELDLRPDRLEVADAVVFMKSGYALLVPTGNPKGIKSEDDLAGKTISFLEASSAGGDLEKISAALVAKGLEPITLQKYPGAPESYAAVANGKADAVLDQRVAVESIVERMQGKLEYSPSVFPTDDGSQYAMYTFKDGEITQPLKEIVQMFFDDGTTSDIAKKSGINPDLLVRP